MAMGVKGGGTGDGTDIRQYTYNGSDSQKFGFIKNSNGSYRIVTKTTNGAKCLAVQYALTTDGGNIFQYTYGSQANDNWFLEKADQAVELTVYSLPNGGHSWITIKNNLGTSIKVDIFPVLAGKEISVGTFGNQKGHIGVWFNVESYYADSADYIGRVSLSQYITIEQLKTISNYIKSNDTWSLYNNCSNFAANAWNSVSSDNLKFSYWPTPTALANEIKKKDGYKTNRSFQKAVSEDIGYKDASSNSIYYAGSSSLSGSLSS